MKYLISSLFCVLLMVNCSSETVNNPVQENLRTDKISLSLIGNQQVQVNNEPAISISALKKDLDAKKLHDETIAYVKAHENTPHGDLIDVQNVLRDLKLLRINYDIKQS